MDEAISPIFLVARDVPLHGTAIANTEFFDGFSEPETKLFEELSHRRGGIFIDIVDVVVNHLVHVGRRIPRLLAKDVIGKSPESRIGATLVVFHLLEGEGIVITGQIFVVIVIEIVDIVEGDVIVEESAIAPRPGARIEIAPGF